VFSRFTVYPLIDSFEKIRQSIKSAVGLTSDGFSMSWGGQCIRRIIKATLKANLGVSGVKGKALNTS
jgi:hypothetical protein